MNGEPRILLDVSRLLSRLGRGPLTGIDRVEAEWLRHLQGRDHLLLCRVPHGQLLLPPAAGAALLRWIVGDLADLPQPGLWDRMRRRLDPRTRAVHALRCMAVLSTSRHARGLGRAALDRLGDGAVYLNIGHANFDRRVFAAMAPLGRVVMIHDTIPLDHPEFTRAGQAEVFRARFMVVTAMADLILTVSQASARMVEFWRGRLGVRRKVPVIATPIGSRLCGADETGLPAGLDLTRPFFVTLGTIEPRKNHALLLDVWDDLARILPAGQIPHLYIIGRRGWENRETFARLDALAQNGSRNGPVREFGDLDDGAVAALMLRCRALLMPSRAEGFGLPLTEAAGRGVPVISAPLDCGREMLGDYPQWLGADDRDGWRDAILRLAQQDVKRLTPCAIPTWQEHFERVHQILMRKGDWSI